MQAKAEIRKQMRGIRKSAEVAGLSDRILCRLKPLIRDYSSFFIYVSAGKEVGTQRLMEELLLQGKLVTVPKVIGERIMRPAIISSLDELCVPVFGYKEPAHSNFYFGSIDVCIVPGVAFSEDGWRLGNGKGYYDKFLSENPTLKIALAYEFQVLPEIPHEPHDVKMDYIVTQMRVICAKK